MVADFFQEMSIGSNHSEITLGELSWIIAVDMVLKLALLILQIARSTRKSNQHQNKGTQEYYRLQSLSYTTSISDPSATNFDDITVTIEESTLEDLNESYMKYSSCANLAQRLFDEDNEPYKTNLYTSHYNEPKPTWPPYDPYDTLNVYSHGKSQGYDYGYPPARQWASHVRMSSVFSFDTGVKYRPDTLEVFQKQDICEVDSIDGTSIGSTNNLSNIYSSPRHLYDVNSSRMREKVSLLEDKNSKMLRTLNVIMKENKDLNEKLRKSQSEKTRAMKDLDDAEKQLDIVVSDKSKIERRYSELEIEKTGWEDSALKLNEENHQLQIQVHSLHRQVSLKESETTALRDNVSELRTELSLSKSDKEFLTNQLASKEEQAIIHIKEIEKLKEDQDALKTKLTSLCESLKDIKLCDSIECPFENSKRAKKRSKGVPNEAYDVTMEIELFVAIENNVKLESTITELRHKLTSLVQTESEGVVNEEKIECQMADVKEVAGSMDKMQRQQNPPANKANSLKKAKVLKQERNKGQVVNGKTGKAKTVKLPKTTKITELMNQNIELDKTNKELTAKVDQLEDELKTAKSQIDMLVKECGNMDHELSRYRKDKNKSSDSLTESIEELRRSNEVIKKVDKREGTGSEDNIFLKTREIKELGDQHVEIKQQMRTSEKKQRELESELEIVNDENVSLKRRIRFIEEKYQEAEMELHHLKSQHYEVNVENAELRRCVSQLNQEIHKERRKLEQYQGKWNSTKGKLDDQISKYKEEIVKYAKKIERYKERERERRKEVVRIENGERNSVNETDSGLAQDDMEEYLDLT